MSSASLSNSLIFNFLSGCKEKALNRNRQFVHIIFVHNFVPLDLTPPNQQSDGFPLEFLLKGLKQNCEHSAKIANKPSLEGPGGLANGYFVNGHFEFQCASETRIF